METTIELRDAIIAWAKTKDDFKTEYQETGDLLIFAFMLVRVWFFPLRRIPVWECVAVAWQYNPPDINLLSPSSELETFLSEFKFPEEDRKLIIEKKY